MTWFIIGIIIVVLIIIFVNSNKRKENPNTDSSLTMDEQEALKEDYISEGVRTEEDPKKL